VQHAHGTVHGRVPVEEAPAGVRGGVVDGDHLDEAPLTGRQARPDRVQALVEQSLVHGVHRHDDGEQDVFHPAHARPSR
jgi:hypothetical protein